MCCIVCKLWIFGNFYILYMLYNFIFYIFCLFYIFHCRIIRRYGVLALGLGGCVASGRPGSILRGACVQVVFVETYHQVGQRTDGQRTTGRTDSGRTTMTGRTKGRTDRGRRRPRDTTTTTEKCQKYIWSMFPYRVQYTESESDIQNNNLVYKIGQ